MKDVKMTAKKNEIAKAGPSEVAGVSQAGQVVPDYLKDKVGTGSGLSAGASDMVVPRVKMLHGTSKEPENFNEAVVGNWWLNVLDRSLGDTFKFIPITNRKRVLLMRPMDDKTGEPILARADDGKTWNTTGEWHIKLKGRKTADVTWTIDDLDVEKSGLLAFGTSDPDDEDSNPAATVFHEYLVYLPGQDVSVPVVLSFARTAAKPARELNAKIELRNVPMQSQVFEACIIKTKNNEGQEFYNVMFKASGFATEAEFAKLTAWQERYKNYRPAEEEGDMAPGEKAAAPKDRGEV